MTDNQIQVFENTEFGNIRTMEINGEPYFVGKDVAAALGYKETAKAIREHIDDEDRGVSVLDTPGGKQKTVIINESGLYSLILSSKLEGAKRFKRWVTSEVLPSIRKTGKYSAGSTAEDYKVRDLRIKEMNAQARLINAETRRLIILQKEKGLSQIAVDALTVKAMESITGQNLGDNLPKTEKTYSASEVGNALGISANKVGKIANANGLKTEEYGVFVLDKSRYSSKEVTSFRYNEKGKQKIKELLGA